MKIINLLVVSAAALSTVACATVTRGTNDDVSFASTPTQAKFEVTNIKTQEKQECIAPCTMKLSRKGSFQVRANKEGYKEHIGSISGDISGQGAAGMAGNVLVGGIIGAGVDAATGAMNDLYPNPYTAVLEALDKTSEAVEEVQEEVLDLTTDLAS